MTLFLTTIIENIRFGKPNATDAEVIEAVKLAMAHDFIQLFPDGYQISVWFVANFSIFSFII